MQTEVFFRSVTIQTRSFVIWTLLYVNAVCFCRPKTVFYFLLWEFNRSSLNCSRKFVLVNTPRFTTLGRATLHQEREEDRSTPSIIKLGGSSRAPNKSRAQRQLPGKQFSTKRAQGWLHQAGVSQVQGPNR